MKVLRSQVARAFRHRDFRLLWIGSFLSFTGSWVQNVAQGWLVFRLTGSEQMLAMVTFCLALPVPSFRFVAGSFTDSLNKQKTLVACQVGYAAGAIYLMAATHFGWIQYGQILAIAFFNGCIACVEMPTRQSLVSQVVPAEDLSAAIPLSAMTFNIARIVGPALGAILLAAVGPQLCYLYNAVSFLGMIFAVMAIKYTYPGRPPRDSSVMDLVLEGARYTMRDKRLKTLFTMEGIVPGFVLAFLPLLPTIAERQLGLGKVGLGNCYTSIGIGAMTSLVLLTTYAERPWRSLVVKGSMTLIGVGLIVLGLTRQPLLAYPIFFLLGMCTLMQFNTTNTLFQIIAPEKLRGRVIAMHIWALNGLGPIGLLLFGWLANQQSLADRVSKGLPSVSLSLVVQGACVLAASIWAIAYRDGLKGIDNLASEVNSNHATA